MTTKQKVLIIGPEQPLRHDLSETVLLSNEVDREWIEDINLAHDRIARVPPHLIVVEWPDETALLQVIYTMRRQEPGSKAGIVVVSRALAAETEGKLLHAGANLILPVPVQHDLWNSHLRQLLSVDPRFNTRVGVTLDLWSINLSADRSACRGICVNISLSGMLIQTQTELQPGAKLDLRFALPGQQHEIRVVGQIKWCMRNSAVSFRCGVEFIVMRNDARRRIAAFIHSFVPATGPGADSITAMGPQDEAAEWERELRISEARKLAILDMSSEAIISVDAMGHILEFNAAAETTFRIRRADALGRLLIDAIVPEAHRNDLHKKFRWLVTQEDHLFETFSSTAAGLRSDGTEFPAQISMKPMMVKGRLVFTFFIRDISALQQAIEAKKEMEDRLFQSQKLEALGTLAGGIAHDFNNILTAIMGYTELSLLAAPEAAHIQPYLENVLLSTTRARDLVKQLLAFSRKGMEACEPVQVNSLIKEVIKLLRATLPATIEIRQRIIDETCMINSNPTRLHQVLMNLCTNAAHAITGAGGIIEIGLEPLTLDAAGADKYAGLIPGTYVHLSVRDSGAGIAPDIMPRIFEPFFTTREGRGTGMGLAVVHGIVKGHGGAITVESEPGQGSVFHILLPRTEVAPVTRADTEAAPTGGTERILLVDDEKNLVKLWTKQFQALGYRIVGLESSIEALQVFQQEPGSFDLVITDMTMPGMTGDILAREIRKIRPDMPVLMCTGFSEAISEERVQQLGIRLAMKPLRITEMIDLIRQMLPPAQPC